MSREARCTVHQVQLAKLPETDGIGAGNGINAAK